MSKEIQGMKFKLFKDKKQEQEIKDTPFINASRTKSVEMSLVSIVVGWHKSYREPYQAELIYVENPEEWTSDKQGLRETTVVIGEDWPNLLDKVAKHFESKEV